MKKTFKVIIAVLVMGIGVLSINFYRQGKVQTSKKAVYDFPYTMNAVSGFLDIMKADENGDPLGGVKFDLSSFEEVFVYNSSSSTVLKREETNGEETLDSSAGPNDGYYEIDDYDDYVSNNDIRKALTSEQVQAIDNVHTKADLEMYFGTNATCDEYELEYFMYGRSPAVFDNVASQKSNGEETVKAQEDLAPASYPLCAAVLPTYFKVTETRAPAGYAKKKVLVPGSIVVYYTSDIEDPNQINSNTPLDLSSINIYSLSNGYHMEFGEVDLNTLTGIDMESAVRAWKRYGEENPYCDNYGPSNMYPSGFTNMLNNYEALPNHAVSNSVARFVFRYCPIYLQNEKGKVELQVSSSVNDQESITTNINQELEYKVVVNNTGTVDAVDNIVKAVLPKDFIYIDGSVSNGGKYENGTITWNVDRLNKGDNITLTYKAYAPKGANAFTSYVGEASVENTAIDGKKVEANKTYVKLSLTNPYTYAPIGVIVLILVIAGIVVAVALKHQVKQK